MPNKKRLIYEFVDNYDALARQAVGMTGNKEDAQDVLQDVALSLLGLSPELDEIISPIAYIRTTIKNTALNYLRTESKTIPTNPEVLNQTNRDDSAYQVNLIEMTDWVNKQLASFSQRDRLAFVMHYIEGYPLVDLAREMNIPYESLKKTFMRMRKKATATLLSSSMILLLMPVLLSSFGDLGRRRTSEMDERFAYLREYPFLLDDAYVITGTEIDRIISSGFPTVRQLVEQAKTKFALPDEAWAEFDAAIAMVEQRSHSAKHRAGRTAFGTWIARHKKLAVACAIVLILTGFFTLIPTGRALAAQFYGFVVSIIEDRIRISNTMPSYETDASGNTAIVVTDFPDPQATAFQTNYTSIEDFTADTGLTPVTVQADTANCENIFYVTNRRIGKSLTIQYAMKDGRHVSLLQIWDEDMDITTRIEGVQYKQKEILGGKLLYYATDPKDKTFNGIAVMGDSVLEIEAEDGVDIDQLLNSLIN